MEEDEGQGGPDDGVEVDARPGQERALEGEDQEGRRGKGEGELGGKVGYEVVVLLLGGGVSGYGVKEEGADVTTEV